MTVSNMIITERDCWHFAGHNKRHRVESEQAYTAVAAYYRQDGEDIFESITDEMMFVKTSDNARSGGERSKVGVDAIRVRSPLTGQARWLLREMLRWDMSQASS